MVADAFGGDGQAIRGSALSLAELRLALSYESTARQLLDGFYIPCLERAVHYDRAVGYFKSSVYALIGVAISDFALRRGRIRLVCSPFMSPADVAAASEGTHLRERLDAALLAEIEALLLRPSNVPVVRLLATLVAVETLEIRIAYRLSERGLFHDKMGIFVDAGGARVSFRGSTNETFAAWHPDVNHESFEVFCSWTTETDRDRVDRHQEYFEALWANELENIRVTPIGQAAREGLLQHADDEGLEMAVDRVRALDGATRPRRRASGIHLQEHQLAVVESWVEAGYRGIIDHATGAGKTLSALEVCRRWLLDRGPALVLVPSRLLADQWDDEAQRFLADFDLALLRADGDHRGWSRTLRDFTLSDQSFGARLTIATYHTASSADFVDQVEAGMHLLVVGDEVHRAGSPTFRRVMEIEAGGRLGLSATPERFGDAAGTSAIFDYFGPVLFPKFDIGDGIRAGRLVPYDYRIELVEMTPDEWEEWQQLSARIGALSAQQSGLHRDTRISDELMLLLIRRARIKKTARNKVTVARRVLTLEYREGDRWLVYCDDQVQLGKVLESLRGADIDVMEYHSSMRGAQSETLEFFERHGGAMVAIRCLDEGIDIPAVDHALILASSTNTREFVQRRGRVLRTNANTGKVSATVFDVLVTSPGGVSSESVLPTELARAQEFAQFARNASVRLRIDRLRALSDVRPSLDDLESLDDDDAFECFPEQDAEGHL